MAIRLYNTTLGPTPSLSYSPTVMASSSSVPAPSVSLVPVSAEDASAFKSSPVFEILNQALQEDTEGNIKKARGIYCFKIKNKDGKEGVWIINTKTGKGTVTFNGKDEPEVTFSIGDEDVINLLSGKLNPNKAYFEGKIKIQGNMGLAMKLTTLLKNVGKKMDTLKSKL